MSLGSTSKQRDVLLASSLAGGSPSGEGGGRAARGQLRRWRSGAWRPGNRTWVFLVLRVVPGHASLRGVAEILQDGEVVSWSLDAVEEGSESVSEWDGQ